jgi:hypothetical protein
MSTNQPTARELRARRILEAGGVKVKNPVDLTFDVQSERNPAHTYRVNLKRGTCDCKDSQALYNAAREIVKPAYVCKHQLAARLFHELVEAANAEYALTRFAKYQRTI